MPANEKRRYVMTSDLRQYIAEYTVANFWRYPIGRRVTYASALELCLYPVYPYYLDTLTSYQTCSKSWKSPFDYLLTGLKTSALWMANSVDLGQVHHSKISGPSWSKLTMSLVNILLKLIIKYGILVYANIFAEKNVSSFCKSYSHFFSKNTCELAIILIRTVNILTTNKLVKLTMLWTTGPWSGCIVC